MTKNHWQQQGIISFLCKDSEPPSSVNLKSVLPDAASMTTARFRLSQPWGFQDKVTAHSRNFIKKKKKKKEQHTEVSKVNQNRQGLVISRLFFSSLGVLYTQHSQGEKSSGLELAQNLQVHQGKENLYGHNVRSTRPSLSNQCQEH